jgi:hypothetical protein
MKSIKEIKDKIKTGFEHDVFGFGVDDLIEALPFEVAKEYLHESFLNKSTAEEEWEALRLKTDDDIKGKMFDYLSFAWDKADGCRGLSADRSIRHFAAWAWLIDDELYSKIEDMYENDYAPYGKPILTFIGDKLGYQKKIA